MSIIVDTHVISDVIHDDPVWRPWAETQMSVHVGALLINPFIYAELCCRAQNIAELDDSLMLLGVGYVLTTDKIDVRHVQIPVSSISETQ